MLGEAVGNHRIVQRLGEGGMGEVFLAEHQTLGTKVAVKFLLPHISSDAAFVRRFFNEAIAASKIAHAGIVRIFDSGHHASGRAYLMMEFLNGETLTRRIHRSGRLSIAQLCDIGKQISSVLEATHQAGIIHRDLKPDNIFLIPDAEFANGERVKVLDFGIAKLTGTFGGATATSMGAMGTPAYMAPEQWKDAAKVDWRADAYSLGCLTFEMACGHPPFKANSIGEACGKHLTEEPPRIRDLVRDLPIQLDTLISRLLAKAPEARPASMREIGRVFAELGVGQPGQLDPTIPSNTLAHQVTVPRAPSADDSRPISVPVPYTPHSRFAGTTLGKATAGLATTQESRRSRRMLTVAALLGALGVFAVIVGMSMRSQEAPASEAASSAEAAGVSDAAVTSAPVAPDAPDRVANAEEPPPAGTHTEVKGRAEAPPPSPPPASRPKERISKPPPPPARSPAPEPLPEPGSVPPPSESGRCDEVSCVLHNYEAKCCEKYGKSSQKFQIAPSVAPPAIPEKLDRFIISEGVANVRARLLACGDKSAVKGIVKLSVKVGPDGNITSVDITSTPDRELGNCAASLMQRASFRKTQKGGSFSYPFVFD